MDFNVKPEKLLAKSRDPHLSDGEIFLNKEEGGSREINIIWTVSHLKAATAFAKGVFSSLKKTMPQQKIGFLGEGLNSENTVSNSNAKAN